MFFKKKLPTKAEIDEEILTEMARLKAEWRRQKEIYELNFDPGMGAECEVRLAEVKYFYLFKEARARKINGR